MLHRRSVRLPCFDYRAPGAYFVNVCTRGRLPLFGEIVHGKMRLSQLGEIVVEEWHAIAALRPYVRLDAFVVMPDHVHGIVWIVEEGAVQTEGVSRYGEGVPRHAPTGPPQARSLSQIVNAFKGAVTRRTQRERLAAGSIWQRGFYEHVIRNRRDLENTRRYITENPMRWHLRQK